MELQFLRPYTRLQYDGWVEKPAIVSFGRACVEWKEEDMGSGQFRTVVSRYRYDLRINLWLIIIDLHWFSNLI